MHRSIRYKYLISLLGLFLFSLIFSSAGNGQSRIEVLGDESVYDNNNHSAFTTMEEWKGYMYLAFREASYHRATETDKGVIKVLKKKGGEWIVNHVFKIEGFDLRDPYFLKWNNRLLMYATGYYSELTKNGWSRLKPYKHNANHRINIWKMRVHNGVAYGIGNCYGRWPLLLKSHDGENWVVIGEFKIGGNASEADMFFVGNTLYTCVRIDTPIGSNSLWGRADYPFKSFQWSLMDVSISSPEMTLLDNKTVLLAGREYIYEQGDNKMKSQVSLLTIDLYGRVCDRLKVDNNSIDQGYASFCYAGNKIYNMSYYTGKKNVSIRLLSFRIKK